MRMAERQRKIIRSGSNGSGRKFGVVYVISPSVSSVIQYMNFHDLYWPVIWILGYLVTWLSGYLVMVLVLDCSDFTLRLSIVNGRGGVLAFCNHTSLYFSHQ